MTENELTTYNQMSEVEKKQYRKHLYDNDRKKFYKLWRYNNQDKSNERHKRYEKRNRDKRIEYYMKQGEGVLNRRLMRDYGITAHDYLGMVNLQDNRCAICGEKETRGQQRIWGETNERLLCVDHNHETGKVRGLLCSKCNSMLGFGKDDPDILQRGIEYIINTDINDPNLQDVVYNGFYGEDTKVNFKINYEDSNKRRSQKEKLFIEQLCRCKICDSELEMGKHAIDHNHLTGKVRGLLCINCNSMIGHGNDDVRKLTKGVEYLKTHMDNDHTLQEFYVLGHHNMTT